MSTTNKRKAPSASYHVGEEAYLRAWKADGTTPGEPTLLVVTVVGSNHNFEKGGWTYEVRWSESSREVAFEVHESQLCRPRYEKGQHVCVVGIGLNRSKSSPGAVIKSVRWYGHTFKYDLTVDLEDVGQGEIVVLNKAKIEGAE